VALAFLLFLGCTGSAVSASPGTSPASRASGKNARAERSAISRVSIVAAGDNLIHDIIYLAAQKDGVYDFDSCYEHIKPVIQSAGIAFVNQETVMGGSGFKPSGYPSFNTPQEAGKALVDAGFDVINHASNHSMDAGEGAVLGTIAFWKQYPGALMLGFFESEAERNTGFRIIEKNGIRVGFLSYTYGLNGYRLPAGKPWLVALIDKPVMEREIAALRPLCDLLVVSMHWGSEFRHDVSAEQKDLSAFLAAQKVDLVLGHHPHVTEPVEIIDRPDGGKLVCYYSLGDLLSHTQSDWTPDTITGALAYIVVKKTTRGNGESATVVETASVIPTVCHYRKGRRPPFTVYSLWDYSDELAAVHYKDKMRLEYLEETARTIFGTRVLDKAAYELLQANNAQSRGKSE
jgi:poly-gamma-glutamate synthesis protein (capsule biosynthesis protein)